MLSTDATKVSDVRRLEPYGLGARQYLGLKKDFCD